MRLATSAALIAALALPPLPAPAAKDAARIPPPAECPALPAGGSPPWKTGETLHYAIDVLGASAGEMALVALPPVGKGDSQEHQFRALTKSNSFFSKIRRVRGKATSYVRGRDMRPRRYFEESWEETSTKSADVAFARPSEGRTVTVSWKRNKVGGKNRLRYGNDAFDPVSAAYYMRTLELKPGQKLCFDAYGIRKLWRVSGEVKAVETIRVPAGVFQAIRIEGLAVRLDNPRSHREVHFWFSADERRLPLAALTVMDVGPVRAQLTQAGEGGDAEKALDFGSSGGKGRAPSAE